MKKASVVIRNEIPASAAGKDVPGPIRGEDESSPPEYLMPYGAAAKAIFIKANGPIAYRISRGPNYFQRSNRTCPG